MAQRLANPTSIHEDLGPIPGLTQWGGDLGLPRAVVQVADMATLLWLWLWYKLAATAPIQPLAWEPPYATCGALKTKKDQKKKVIINKKELWKGLFEKYKCLIFRP